MAFNAYICQIRKFPSWKSFKRSTELDLENWLILSTDQNVEYTHVIDVHIVAKLVATFTALKRTTKQHRATTNLICHHDRMNCSNYQTLGQKKCEKNWPHISTGQQSKLLD